MGDTPNDQGAIFAAVFGTHPQPASEAAPMYSIDDGLRRVAEKVDGPMTDVDTENWGGRNARYAFYLDPGGVLLTGAETKVDAATTLPCAVGLPLLDFIPSGETATSDLSNS